MSSKKETILSAIRAAKAVKLKEQDTYREIIRAACATEATEKHYQVLHEFGWQRIVDHMTGEHWPPQMIDWKERYQLTWEQEPKVLLLAAIEDEDIRGCLYFYSEVAEQTERLKATARFYSLFGAKDKLLALLFLHWVYQTVTVAMKQQVDIPENLHPDVRARQEKFLRTHCPFLFTVKEG